MPARLLFIVGQVGSTAFFAPLWRRWLQVGAPVDWRVVAASVANPRLTGLTAAVCDDADADGLASVLGDWRPHAVVMSASHASVDSAGLAFAGREGLPVARAVETWYGYANRILGREGHLQLPERVLLIDDVAARQAAAEGIPEHLITLVGQPAWESLPSLPPADPRRVVFVDQPVRRARGSSLGYDEQSAWALLAHLSRERSDLVADLVYAPHPDNDWLPMPGDKVAIATDARAALADCGTVVGMFSSLLMDAVLQGRRVISVQPGAVGYNLAEFGRPGLIPVAYDQAGLVHWLSSARPAAGDLAEILVGSCERLERFCLNFAAEAAASS